MSDAPNYFTETFGPGDRSVINLDRSPDVFTYIVRHLQGYYVTPRDDEHYVYLIADASYYRLAKLTEQLLSSYVFNVGGQPFSIEAELLREKDSPNFFTIIPDLFDAARPAHRDALNKTASTPLPFLSLGNINHIPSDADVDTLHIRPPPFQSPKLPRKDGTIFKDLLQLLQGYELDVRSPAHRKNLIRDSQFFHFRELKERLQVAELTWHPSGLEEEGYETDPESTPIHQLHIMLSDMRINFASLVAYRRVHDGESARKKRRTENGQADDKVDIIFYKRTIDKVPGLLLAQTTYRIKVGNGETTREATVYEPGDIIKIKLIMRKFVTKDSTGSADPTPSQMTIHIRYNPSAWIELDHTADRPDTSDDIELKWSKLRYIDRGIWRLNIEQVDGAPRLILEAVKVQGWSDIRAINRARQFFSSASCPNNGNVAENRVVGLQS